MVASQQVPFKCYLCFLFSLLRDYKAMLNTAKNLAKHCHCVLKLNAWELWLLCLSLQLLW
jgi:hypothetical protein